MKLRRGMFIAWGDECDRYYPSQRATAIDNSGNVRLEGTNIVVNVNHRTDLRLIF